MFKTNRLALAVAAAMAAFTGAAGAASAEKVHHGCTYTVEVVRDGQVVRSFQAYNLMPEQGRNDMLNVYFNRTAAQAGWFFGVFEGNSVPSDDLTADTWVSRLGECTTYTPATRPAFSSAAAAAGETNNTASRAEMTFTAAKTIYGAVIVSSAAKGSGAGVMASAVRFDDPQVLRAGDTLRLTGSFNLVSA